MVWAGAMPDAFAQFEQHFAAKRISLICNWRSHEDVVRIQRVIATRIDPNVEEPEARANRFVDGDVAAIWEFTTEDEESDYLARWIEREVQAGNVEPHDLASRCSHPLAIEVPRSVASSFAKQLLAFLGRLYLPKLDQQQHVICDLERAADDERRSAPRQRKQRSGDGRAH